MCKSTEKPSAVALTPTAVFWQVHRDVHCFHYGAASALAPIVDEKLSIFADRDFGHVHFGGAGALSAPFWRGDIQASVHLI